MGHGESAATPLLREFAERWPLSLQDKAMLAELFAYQLLRGPRWKDEYETRTREIFDRYREEGKLGDTALAEEQLNEFERHLSTDGYRFIRMFAVAPTIASVLASMHWTLVEFVRGLVATSDHPIVLWPLAARSRPPQRTRLHEVGILECFEIRLPLSPHHAVLMTWAEGRLSERARIRGTRDHAANLNAFTVAEADRQWFHHPALVPPIGVGTFVPLAGEVIRGYTVESAASSVTRAAVSEHVKSKVPHDLRDREITVFRANYTT